MFTSVCGSFGGSWVPRLQMGLQQGTDVVGKGIAVWQGGVCQLVWLLSDVVVIVTHPFLAATTLRSGQPGPRAAPVGQGHLVRTEGHTAHHAVHAGALVLAVGLEVLAMLVHPPAELTRQTLGLGCQEKNRKQRCEVRPLIIREVHSRKTCICTQTQIILQSLQDQTVQRNMFAKREYFKMPCSLNNLNASLCNSRSICL